MSTYAYELIERFYGKRRAKRSGVLLMDHIDQGLIVLDALRAGQPTKDAFCLHPLFQADAELTTIGLDVSHAYSNAYTIMLVMEYRQWANAWLSDKATHTGGRDGTFVQHGTPTPGPLLEVKHMLIADKVQNYKDFCAHHYGTHARSKELDFYFKTWLRALGVSNERYLDLCALIDDSKRKG